jgi:hypothetical protein
LSSAFALLLDIAARADEPVVRRLAPTTNNKGANDARQ